MDPFTSFITAVSGLFAIKDARDQKKDARKLRKEAAKKALEEDQEEQEQRKNVRRRALPKRRQMKRGRLSTSLDNRSTLG